MSYSLGQEITGLGCVRIISGVDKLPSGGKHQLVMIGHGTIEGCTQNNLGKSTIPVIVYIEKYKQIYFGMFLNKLLGGESIDKIMAKATIFVSESEAKLKEHYGASKVNIDYLWRT